MKPSFDRFFDRVRESTGIANQNDLARFLGVHRSAITQAKAKGRVPDKWILKLSQSYGLDSGWLQTGTGHALAADGRFMRIPKVKARLSAGGGSFVVDPYVDHYHSFRRDWLGKKGDPKRMVMMDVTGNSMEPELKDGDTLLIDRSRTEILYGAVYAVGVDDAILVKRLEKRPGGLALMSDNPAHAPIEIIGDEVEGIRIIGKVIWVGREYR